jgi:hypothetical protein
MYVDRHNYEDNNISTINDVFFYKTYVSMLTRKSFRTSYLNHHQNNKIFKKKNKFEVFFFFEENF